MARQKTIYEAAKARHPARWSGAIRNWREVEVVYLNLDKPESSQISQVETIAA